MSRILLAFGIVAVMAVGIEAHKDRHWPWHNGFGACLDQTDPVGYCQWSCVMHGHGGATSCCNNWCACTD